MQDLIISKICTDDIYSEVITPQVVHTVINRREPRILNCVSISTILVVIRDAIIMIPFLTFMKNINIPPRKR